jgi:hypothetical protein
MLSGLSLAAASRGQLLGVTFRAANPQFIAVFSSIQLNSSVTLLVFASHVDFIVRFTFETSLALHFGGKGQL